MALPTAPTDGGLDADRLGRIMKALGNPVRLELLKSLRSPRSLGEIRLRPLRTEKSVRPDRPMSRVTVRGHLEQLIAIGVVGQRRAVKDGRAVDQYVVSHRQLFALTEELRQMATLRPEGPTGGDGTLPSGDAARDGPPRGPRAVLVNGVGEGRVFTLAAPTPATARRWVIGRRRGAAIHIDYDPYMSGENSAVALEEGRYWLLDLPPARNGTFLNWERLPKGGRAPLVSGDVIGAGRSLLVFRHA